MSSAHDSASSFLNAYDSSSPEVQASDVGEDLLRAMLLFTSAGLDSTAKQLVRDALPQVIQLQEGARENLRDYVERRLLRDERAAARMLAVALSSANPRAELVDALVTELVGGSLQSAEELSRLASFFDIPTTELVPDQRLLAEIFQARNQLAHELDVEFGQNERHRRNRERETMLRYATELFGIATTLLISVGKRV